MTTKPTKAVRDFEKVIEQADQINRAKEKPRAGYHRVSALAMFRHFSRSKYMPHQSDREISRRART